jgi:hypothetical protein
MNTQRHLTQFGLAAETTPGARPYATLSQRPDEEGVFATDEDHAPLSDDDDARDDARDYARDEWPIVPGRYQVHHLRPTTGPEIILLLDTSNGCAWQLHELLHGSWRLTVIPIEQD